MFSTWLWQTGFQVVPMISASWCPCPFITPTLWVWARGFNLPSVICTVTCFWRIAYWQMWGNVIPINTLLYIRLCPESKLTLECLSLLCFWRSKLPWILQPQINEFFQKPEGVGQKPQASDENLALTTPWWQSYETKQMTSLPKLCLAFWPTETMR